MSSTVVERIELEIDGQAVIVERLEDGTFLKPDYLAGAEREVVGPRIRRGDKKVYPKNASRDEAGYQGLACGKGKDNEMGYITAPATDLAQTWDGYGTALKPAYEPVILARKPRGKT